MLLNNLKWSWFCILLLICLSSGIYAQPDSLTEEELEKWFSDDSRSSPFDTDVNEGELQFLIKPPKKRTPHSKNIINIYDSSLDNGWVGIEQCHEQLDPINAVEVVYRYKNLRHLQVIEATNISKAWIDNNSIQLEDVRKNARLCVLLEAKILYQQENGIYFLKNGPFERKFLDGYFPMHVSLTVRYPINRLKYSHIKPNIQPGFDVIIDENVIAIDSWFEGKLTIELYFRPVI